MNPSPKRSLAAAALAKGQAMLGRSFRMHRPRGAFCHDGWCQQCKVRLADGRVVLACQEACDVAMRPRSALMRVFGWIAERQPPWFYEGHFLRPAALRQFYLNLLRRMSGALPLPEAAPGDGEPWRRLRCDALVVGGGTPGLIAAAQLRLAGKEVVVVDAGRPFAPADASREEARRMAVTSGCALLDGALCVGLYENPRRALCVDPRGTIVIEHDELVVATGAYDRLLPFPNNDLPGIVGVRALEILLSQDGVPRDSNVGIYGESAEVERGLRALNAHARPPRWIAGPLALPDAPAGVASYPGTSIERANGSERIRAVTLQRVGDVECDLLVLGFSQPGYELQMQRQARLEVRGKPGKLLPDVSGTGVTVVGAAAHTAEVAQLDLPRHHPDAFICPCEDVRVRDVEQAIADGYADMELVKRHTGAATGPCQGKLCHGNLMDCLAANGVQPRIPTQRPLVRPIRFAQFAGAGEE
jgi:sarcosine oxidase subunit alpha